MLRLCAALAFALALCTTSLRAQTYESPHPVPRSTNAATLRNDAVAREIVERFHVGLDAEARSDWSAAASEFERILALHPKEPQGSTAHYDLSIAYANSGRLDDAATQLQAAIALDPGFLAAMANLVAVDLRRGDMSHARQVADRFVAIAPDSARALYSRGLVALRQGDARAAQADFSKLLTDNPQYPVAHYDMGLAELQLHEYTSAERDFSLALNSEPSYAAARIALGGVLLKEGRRADAHAAFVRAADDSVNDPAVHNYAVALRDASSPP